jgi:hypothetical protein
MRILPAMIITWNIIIFWHNPSFCFAGDSRGRDVSERKFRHFAKSNLGFAYVKPGFPAAINRGQTTIN